LIYKLIRQFKLKISLIAQYPYIGRIISKANKNTERGELAGIPLAATAGNRYSKFSLVMTPVLTAGESLFLAGY